MPVVMEMDHVGGWVKIGASLTPDDPPGSISSHESLGRQVYVFGFHEGKAGVWRSAGGFDFEEGLGRTITSLELVLVADLEQGPHEMTVHHPVRRDVRLRFRMEEL